MKRDLLSKPVRRQLRRLPPPFQNHYGVVPLRPPEHSISAGEHGGPLRKALDVIASMVAGVPAPDAFDLAMRDEAMASCEIEDITAPVDEIEEYRRTGRGSCSAKLIGDYWQSLDSLITRARADRGSIFSSDFVADIHRRLMRADDAYRDVPGSLRRKVVWIGSSASIAESTWNPPPPDDVAACLDDTIDYMRNEGMQQMTQSIVVRLAVAHAHFEAVHPFLDGNGRVGRFLLPLMSVADGHYPLFLSSFLAEARHRYYRALQAAQQRLDYSLLVGLFSEAILSQGDVCQTA